MNPPSVDVKDILVAAGIGAFASPTGWSIHISREPVPVAGKVPDTTITLFDTPGFAPNPKLLQDNPGLQIRVRGAPNGYPAAYAKALQVRDALLGLPAQVVNGTRYVGVWALGDIGHLGYDEGNRPLFTLNFKLTREPAAGRYRS